MTEALSKLTVLVVDDSPVSRKLVEHALEQEAYAPVFAQNGSEALELYAKHAPSIVITDWMMPDLSGLELCQHVRGDAQHPYTYIIVLTSKSEKDNVVEGLGAGADDYLTKPFDPSELLARIGVGRRTVELHREIEAKNKLLKKMALTDSLTDLPNRRALEEWAGRQLRGAARHGYSIWVVYLDLDLFKNINDSHGHDAGDEVLRKLAKILRENTRASDISGRIGGDEFLWVITHGDEKGMRTAVERLREQFSSQKFCFGSDNISVSASYGACGFRGNQPPDFRELVKKADEALYGAKRAGRNQIKIEIL